MDILWIGNGLISFYGDYTALNGLVGTDWF
jgi:hypothetical protein